ncbi:MAG: hypothetical protein OEM41_02530 [Ignavibacteria bacterium]|nr:hypothetical protein [Ignavibacteria bacterium]
MDVILTSLVLLLLPAHADTAVIAQVGTFTISVQDLKESFEFGPAFVRRAADPVRTHLDYMIRERLIALEAMESNADTTAFVRERRAALEEDLAVDQLYEREVRSKVHVTEEEIATGMQKARMHIRLRWLFGRDRSAAEAYSRQLRNGLSFDSLYARRMRIDDAEDRSLETTLLRLEHENADFAEMIRSLRPREISAPLEGPDGFYIVRIDMIWQDPLLTESAAGDLRYESEKLIREGKADLLAAEYVKHHMASANPVITADGYNIVRAYLADKGLSRDTRLKWEIPATFMTEAGPMPISGAGEFLNRPLVRFGKSTLTVRDYVAWFDIRQFQLSTTSPGAFNSSIRRTIWKLVQDRLLSREAYARNLHRPEAVRQELALWEAKLLYLVGRTRLLRSITLDDGRLRSTYQRYEHRYRDASGRLLSYTEALEEVRVDAYYDLESSVLHREVDRLRKTYPVVLYEDRLRQLALSYESDHQAIQVMFYKPGGTFPRVAFPTIDESWQRTP